jgi:hypothetical protein
MKIGLFGINVGISNDVDVLLRIAQAGLESVWTGEPVVLPDPRIAPWTVFSSVVS